MTDIDKQIARPPVHFYAAVTVIVGMTVGGMLFRQDQAATIVTFGGSVLAALMAIFREQHNIHTLINSRMTQLLKATRKEGYDDGVLDRKE